MGSSMKTRRGWGDEGAGDLQALEHAAGEGGGEVVDAGRVDLDLGEPVHGGGADLGVVAGAGGHEALADVAAGGDAHAERLAGVLVDEAPVGAVQGAQGGGGEGEEVLRVAVGGAGRGRSRWPGGGGEARHVEEGGLAGTGFADDGEDLAGVEGGVDVDEGGDGAEMEG